MQSGGSQRKRDTSVVVGEDGLPRTDVHDAACPDPDPERHEMELLERRPAEDGPGAASSQVSQLLHGIQAKLDVLAAALSSKEELSAAELRAKEEWRTVAIVLDRVFFVVFSFLVLITAVSLFSGLPLEHDDLGF